MVLPSLALTYIAYVLGGLGVTGTLRPP